MSLGFTDDKSALVQVMAWCRQATRHNLNQCWPRFKPPSGITRPQWVWILVLAVDKPCVNFLGRIMHASWTIWTILIVPSPSQGYITSHKAGYFVYCYMPGYPWHGFQNTFFNDACVKMPNQQKVKDPGTLFTKQMNVLPHDLVKSRSREIRV